MIDFLTKTVVDGGWINDRSVEIMESEGRQKDHLEILLLSEEMQEGSRTDQEAGNLLLVNTVL